MSKLHELRRTWGVKNARAYEEMADVMADIRRRAQTMYRPASLVMRAELRGGKRCLVIYVDKMSRRSYVETAPNIWTLYIFTFPIKEFSSREACILNAKNMFGESLVFLEAV